MWMRTMLAQAQPLQWETAKGKLHVDANNAGTSTIFAMGDCRGETPYCSYPNKCSVLITHEAGLRHLF